MAQILFKNANSLDPHADALQGGVSVVVEGESIREVSAKAIKAANADVVAVTLARVAHRLTR
jgi:hypothetical protein